ncbi:inorganic diphosphatase [Kaarinaea lacus]
MNLDRVSSGNDVPNDVNVIIEIPSHSGPVKYEMDKETDAMFVDHFMNTAVYYPCNYGYMPQSLLDKFYHFFACYKDLEPNKWVKDEGRVGSADTKQEILDGVERFNAAPEKLCF